MYLSRLDLNTRSRAVRRDLADCYLMHRTVMSGFPDLDGANGTARARLGVLYRIELPHEAAPVLLVQSEVQPDWSHLEEPYLLRPVQWKALGDVYRGLEAGRVLRFRLLANPTRKINTKSGPDGRRSNGARVELRDEEQWTQWLDRKAAQHGFRLLAVRAAHNVADVRTAKQGKITGTKTATGTDSGYALTLFGVQFDGRLVIQDRGLFAAALRNGIGPGKAYGFGLLSIAGG